MSGFKGNPESDGLWAIAHELRTANLIAMHTRGVTDLTGWPEAFVDQWLALGRDIETRLGLRGGGE